MHQEYGTNSDETAHLIDLGGNTERLLQKVGELALALRDVDVARKNARTLRSGRLWLVRVAGKLHEPS